MKRVFFAICILTLAVPVFAADPAEGYWKSFDEKDKKKVNAYWKIWAQDGILFGTIVNLPGKPSTESFTAFKPGSKKEYDKSPSAPISATTPIIGTIWMFGLQFKKTGFWVEGRIIHSGKGEVYGAECEYKNEHSKEILEFRGYIVGLSLFKQTQKWERASAADLESIGITP